MHIFRHSRQARTMRESVMKHNNRMPESSRSISLTVAQSQRPAPSHEVSRTLQNVFSCIRSPTNQQQDPSATFPLTNILLYPATETSRPYHDPPGLSDRQLDENVPSNANIIAERILAVHCHLMSDQLTESQALLRSEQKRCTEQ